MGIHAQTLGSNFIDMNLKINLAVFGTIAATVVLPCGMFFTMGGILNTNASIPPGLYWEVDKPIAKDRYITVCPPNRPEFQDALNRGQISSGNCPDKYGKMLIKVAAKARDTVSINAQGITVNDNLLPHSQPLKEDAANPVLPTAALDHYPLKPNEILVISEDDKNPFDSRYFGVLDVGQIDSVVTPLIQW